MIDRTPGPRIPIVACGCFLLFSIGCIPQGKIALGADQAGQPSTLSTCVSPIQPVDVSQPTTVIGTGVRSSCTEAALEQALLRGGIIVFNCGGNATIRFSSEKRLRSDVNTIIDGQGQITLDGNGNTRLFRFVGPNWRTTTITVTLQNIALINGRGRGTAIPEIPGQPPQCSRGFHLDGGGGAVFIQDGVLHVFNTVFQNNQAEPLGPDVAGGGIYALGSQEVVVVNSRFINNSGANGGAIGSLNSDLAVINSVFDQGNALGQDGNISDPSCVEGEAGSGGSGGAIYIDGGGDLTHTFCGNRFSGNRAGTNALGGAIFRVSDVDPQTTIIDQCTFDANSSPGGGALYFHNSDLRITRSTFANNAARIGGSLQADSTILFVENSTFFNNQASGPWGVVALFDGRGDIHNSTFVANRADFSPIAPDFTAFTIENSIFFDSVATGGILACDAASSGSGNLQWPDPGVSGPNSLSGCVSGVSIGDPQLPDLANNGGPTLTFLPALSSSAIGRGTGCPETDQRNVRRGNRSACTVGSVEIL